MNFKFFGFFTHVHINISTRRQLKTNDFLIWKLIFLLIQQNILIISLYKVKAHANDKHDESDQLDV